MPAPSTTTFLAVCVTASAARPRAPLTACRSKKNAWIMFLETEPTAREVNQRPSIASAVSTSTCAPSTATAMIALGAG